MLMNEVLQLCPDLNLDNIQANFKNGTEKLLSSRDEAKKCLDLAVNEINTKLLSTILLHRAAVQESRGNLILARRDAYSAIAYAKHIADGYIFTYNIHLLEDRVQDACYIMDEGLKWVPTTDPKYPKLNYLKNHALAELDNRNRWRLPYHIVSIILDLLDFADRVCLASTCRYWQNLLHHGSSGIMWSRINLPPSFTNRDSFFNLFGNASSKAIRNVETCTMSMMALVNQAEWRDIETLGCKDLLVTDINLNATIRRNMATLKELSIVDIPVGQVNVERMLDEILTSTPHLTRFTLRFKAYSEAFRNFQLPPQPLLLPPPLVPLPLTHLSFSEIRCLIPVLRYCLNLRYIELFEHDLVGTAPQIFNLIDKYCPNLISFRYGSCNHGIKMPVDELLGNISSSAQQWLIPSHESGLRELAYLPEALVDEDIVRIIRCNLATLETLRLNLWAMGGSRVYIVHSLAGDLNHRVRELELRGRHVGFGSGVTNISADAACELINVCPNLETLSLENIDILNDNLYRMVGSLLKIRRLCIRGYIRHICDHERPLHCCSLPVMFEKTNTLEDFFVESNPNGIDVSSYFHAMSAHQGLRRVHLKCSGSMNVVGTHIIANVLNRLTYLALECTQDMTFPEMTFFHLLPRLKLLKLRSGTPVTKMTNESISTLFHKRRENNAASLQISIYEGQGTARIYWSETMEKSVKVDNKVLPATSIGDNDHSSIQALYHDERKRVAKVVGTWTVNRWIYPGFTKYKADD